jgi:hypothetical protein
MHPIKCFANTLLVALMATVVCACTAFRLHDDARASLAADGKQTYVDIKVTEVIEADRKNLALLLGEEIKVVRDNYQLQVDYATLEIANDATPMARAYAEGKDRLTELGVDSIKQLRDLLQGASRRANTQNSLNTAAKVLLAKKVTPPDCASLPASLALPPGMSAADQKVMNSVYERYRTLCADLAVAVPTKGRLGEAYREWTEARRTLAASRTQQEQAIGALAQAKASYDATAAEVAAGAAKGAELSKELADKAGLLASALKQASEVGGGLANEEQIGALVTLLTAAAGGEVNPQDPELGRAVIVAKQIPSLAGAVADIEAKRTAPPVSGLLLALRHQTLLADAAKKRVALEEERVAILRAKYDAYYAEAERWLRFTDAMCSYAVVSNSQPHPGQACNGFSVDAKGACMLDGKAMKCVLVQAWKTRLRAAEDPEAKRELYKAMTNYLQALTLESVPAIETFKEIDVRHRQMLVAKDTAIQAWDNLVAIPLDQLNGYYQGGVKPAEIADLLVKALGFTAIAIGVAK